MDSFKLLTKGTSLLKTSQASSISVVPSAGPAKQAAVLADEISNPLTDRQPVSRKRRRTGRIVALDTNQQDKAQVPDFFDLNTPEKNETERVRVIKPNSTTEPVRQPEETSFQQLSEDECKQILKKNKLKISLMGLRKPKGSTSKKTKKGLVQLSPQPLTSFRELRPRFKISRRLASNIAEQGYSSPTEVQLAAIPILLGNDEDRGLSGLLKSKQSQESHVDLMSIAPTGSGKTLAFLIPLIQGLLNFKHANASGKDDSSSYVKAIVLAPTHELADQISNEARKLVQGTRLRVAGMRKGMRLLNPSDDDGAFGMADAMVKAEILVSTPLVLLNSITEGFSKPQKILSAYFLVLDEADVLLDPLFREQTLSIWKACTNSSLRVSLWSATMGASIEQLSQEFIMKRRKELGLSSKHHRIIRLIAGLKDSALPIVSHRLIYAATEQGKLLAVRQILHPTVATSETNLRPPFLIFTQTIPRASALHSELLYDIPLEAGGSSRIAVLHSSLSDAARSDVMARFRKGEIWVLITTDLLSRGVDFRGVNGIVNYDIPTTSAAYIHRAGRTGRAGREGGIAVTLYTKEDIPYVKNVANVIAASERVHGKKSNGEGGEAVPKWLLEALPHVSKKTKKDLKKRGVEERRTDSQSRAVKISTKSGFQRREDNRKKGAISASRKRRLDFDDQDGTGDESEWGGLEE